MIVLLTRPWDEGLRTAEKLAELGHACVLSPVIEIVPSGAAWPHGVIDAIVATSARAFEALNLARDWPLPETLRLFPLFVVGAMTAEAARLRGFEGPLRATLDSKALCSVLGETLAPPQRVLYLAGRDRKSEIESFCLDLGLTLDVAETYLAQRAPSLSDDALSRLRAGEIDAIVHFSRRSAEIFLGLAADAQLDLAPLIHVAISDDVAAPLAALPKVVVAPEPNEAAILALFRAVPAGVSAASLAAL